MSATHSRVLGRLTWKFRSTRSGCRTAVLASQGRACLASAANAFNAGDFHQSGHPVFAHQVTFLSKFRRNAGSSIGPTTLLVDPVDCFQKTSIRFISSRRSAIDPRVVATGGDTQQTAHGGDWIVGLIHFHEPEDSLEIGSLSRANQAAAFANISRSTLSCLFSLRNFRSSARSTVVRPSLRRPSSRSAWAIQLRIVCSLGSNSRASSPGLRPAR